MYDKQKKLVKDILALAREARFKALEVEGEAFSLESTEVAGIADDLEEKASALASLIEDTERIEERKQLFPEEYAL